MRPTDRNAQTWPDVLRVTLPQPMYRTHIPRRNGTSTQMREMMLSSKCLLTAAFINSANYFLICATLSNPTAERALVSIITVLACKRPAITKVSDEFESQRFISLTCDHIPMNIHALPWNHASLTQTSKTQAPSQYAVEQHGLLHVTQVVSATS